MKKIEITVSEIDSDLIEIYADGERVGGAMRNGAGFWTMKVAAHRDLDSLKVEAGEIINGTSEELDEVDRAFEQAIESGRLSANKGDDNFAGDYMFMGNYKSGDAFKHVLTRRYIPAVAA